ncbi:wiskott-Aldrich syndrome protein homolog 1 [Ceratitis capitata]|uniref:wiskott-Aldrich syndrome protein homolog 1 n=1 Tax=Ceratitis capitata TaxID=7213 RepID=UPI000329A348|nr:wiskott-Aldrich syndrome protein homolog 1 [Ceratitis capitata]XP_020712768.1 wiskott-Aldrich syndrome protein homolog 1 [Ceratitis capitata]XP_020712769.1 wiskott-Aldrich syndrome protein homolog 1 [Ceratitis capitata]
MDRNYISAPDDFHYMEGTESVEFKRTFALDGIGEDETLRLYLRKAGLSDEIEYLTPEQRRAFIYDIIKSNKMPGYWMPSTMTSASPLNLSNTPTTIRRTPPPPPIRKTNTATSTLRTNNSAVSTTLSYATISTSSSNNSLKSLDNSSPIVPRRFEPQPPTPPSPSTFVTSIKGSKYEISGPMNFQHVAGDMTRDRTRNAFDLTLTTNDNVLRKYMLERGITEEDLRGVRKEEIIKNIVQSKFTWMPPKRSNNDTASRPPPNVMYATISTGSEYTLSESPRFSRARKPMHAPPPPPPPPASTTTTTATAETAESNRNPTTTPSQPPKAPSPIGQPTTTQNTLSGFNSLALRFADPSDFPSIEDIYSSNTEMEDDYSYPRQTLRQSPLPPTVKPKPIVDAPTPPPPSLVKADNKKSSVIYHSNQSLYSLDECESEGLYVGTATSLNGMASAPDLTAPPSVDNHLYATINKDNGGRSYARVGNKKQLTPPPTPPKPMPKPQFLVKAQPVSTFTPPPPPPAPQNVSRSVSAKPTPPIPASAVPIAPPPPPPPASGIPIPPPPPPINSMPKPPLPLSSSSGSPIPPLPPPMQNPTAKGTRGPSAPAMISADNGDARGALLDSIRNGITLKKVDQKAATISGVKPRTERKPPATDFLSELKLGITLRRVKDKADNPYASEDPDESQA